jgi:hypothetical protein
MTMKKTRSRTTLAAAAALMPVLLLSACGGGSDDDLPRLAEATPASLLSCTDLAGKIAFANTTITASELIAAGTLKVAGKDVGEHCRVTGRMYQRVSAVDGQNYAIGFEMRMPRSWNGRFFYQANGGIDGSVVTAAGGVGGGGVLDNALNKGFAVLSSDAGHGAPTPFFGLDPQARLDYGYQAVGKLTPMAKSAIQTAYGKAPDRSYLGGCSNGGRHAMVAASRYADQYDGILAGNPGFSLPKAATAQLWKAQQYAKVATKDANGQPDLTKAVSPAEFQLIGRKIVERCDALDGATDGQVNDVQACQAAFNLQRDVPTCTAANTARDGSCISAEQ